MLKLKQLFAILLALTLAAPLNIKASDDDISETSETSEAANAAKAKTALGVSLAIQGVGAAGGLAAAATGLAQLLKAKNPKAVFYSRHDTFGNPLPKGQKRQLTNSDELEAARTEAKWKAIELIASGLPAILPVTVSGIVTVGVKALNIKFVGLELLVSTLANSLLAAISATGLGLTARIASSRAGGYSFDGTNIYSRKDLAGNNLKKGHRRLVEPNSTEYRTALAGKMRLAKLLNTVNASVPGGFAAGATVNLGSLLGAIFS